MAKQAEGCAVLRLSKAAAGKEGLAKTCHVAVSKPNRNSLKGLWGGTMAKQAEGCAVLRLSKAAAGLLRLLRPGQKAWPKRAMSKAVKAWPKRAM